MDAPGNGLLTWYNRCVGAGGLQVMMGRKHPFTPDHIYKCVRSSWGYRDVRSQVTVSRFFGGWGEISSNHNLVPRGLCVRSSSFSRGGPWGLGCSNHILKRHIEWTISSGYSLLGIWVSFLPTRSPYPLVSGSRRRSCLFVRWLQPRLQVSESWWVWHFVRSE